MFNAEMEFDQTQLAFCVYCLRVQGETGPPGVTGPVGPRGDPGEPVRIVLWLLNDTTCWRLSITVLLCYLAGPSGAARPQRSWWDTRPPRKRHILTGNIKILLVLPEALQAAEVPLWQLFGPIKLQRSPWASVRLFKCLTETWTCSRLLHKSVCRPSPASYLTVQNWNKFCVVCSCQSKFKTNSSSVCYGVHLFSTLVSNQSALIRKRSWLITLNLCLKNYFGALKGITCMSGFSIESLRSPVWSGQARF